MAAHATGWVLCAIVVQPIHYVPNRSNPFHLWEPYKMYISTFILQFTLGPIPHEVSNMKSLISLSLENNSLSGSIPASIGSLG